MSEIKQEISKGSVEHLVNPPEVTDALPPDQITAEDGGAPDEITGDSNAADESDPIAAGKRAL